jgi:nucleoside-diphosphate-sugar epimerase
VIRNELESPSDPWLQEDLEKLAMSDLPLDELRDCTILVTGATGLVGSQTVRALACINRLRKTNIQILAMIRNTKKASAIFGDLLRRGDIYPVVADLNEHFEISSDIDYVIHCAAVTTSKTMISRPVETIETAIEGTINLMETVRHKNLRAFLYISSMEVYGQWDGSRDVTEDVMGYVDPLVIRSNYPMCKRMCENLCIAYSAEYGVNVRIARLAQTFGAGVLPGENRVFAQFARAAMSGTDIVLHTRGLSEGNYCYTADTVRGLLMILAKGSNGEAYNICNEDTHTTIGGMAEFVADNIAGGKISVTYDIPESNAYGYAADTKMKLSSSKLRELGWKPHYSLEDCYRRMMGTMSTFAT